MTIIKYAQRDLLAGATEGILMHACNTEGSMGSGIAPLIAKKYPAALQVYKEQHNKAVSAAIKAENPYAYRNMLLGRCSWAHCGKLYIANLVTQTLNPDFSGHPTSLDAIESALVAVNRNYSIIVAKLGVDQVEVNMPLICAVRGGVDWRITRAIIESVMPNIPEVIVNVLPSEWNKFSKLGWIPAEPHM